MTTLNMALCPEYTVDSISNHMSLRTPQRQSLKVLDTILGDIELSKAGNIKQQELDIHALYPIFREFEHDFMSLTYALATGVGKTKLMGAFMTYLYAQKGVKNFFVVAPNLTIYSKLKNDLGNPSPDNEKYVFRGVGCFATKQPNVWVDDDYKDRPIHGLADSDSINIYIFNISKFNSEERNIKSLNEVLGISFFEYLQSLEDLVIIMDESHHYRAKNSAAAINSLKPVLGLELTATPQVQSGSREVLFRNVVYEYPLSSAIRDGYTRTPYALTRRDIRSYNMTPEELDKTMINDGIIHHENMRVELKKYSVNNHEKLVKPFMLIVCKDTAHAKWVLDYVKSDAFREGKYKDKVIMVHSNQSGAEKEENIQKLLEVERPDNPVEIVIHVNILKEGWDVNNLYTIVPLRTAASKTLREQTVGRGLRLPFGRRTGEKLVDSVTITAHDKFDEIIAEAQRGDSIFKADGVIYAEMERERRIVPAAISLFDDNQIRGEVISEAGLDHNDETVRNLANQVLNMISSAAVNAATQDSQVVSKKTKNADRLTFAREQASRDLAERFGENQDVQKLLEAAFGVFGESIIERAVERTMYIPKLKTENQGEEEYKISDFDLDMSEMDSYVPIENEMLIKNLLDSREEAQVIRGSVIDFDSVKPEIRLVDCVREVGEIDYEKCPELIQKIVMQFLTYYRGKYSEEKVRNIVLSYRKDITNKFKAQLLQHLIVSYKGLVEVATGVTDIVRGAVDYSGGEKDIAEPSGEEDIRSICYRGGSKALVAPFKFDSEPERLFALACENSPEVVQWLRPAPTQFNITYNRGHRYEPDFVVETADMYYLVEVKDRRRLNEPDVQAKKERAIKYCKVATEYNLANGHKGFKYLFIPHDEIASSSSFNNLKQRFLEE